jgi:hypothetical protein
MLFFTACTTKTQIMYLKYQQTRSKFHTYVLPTCIVLLPLLTACLSIVAVLYAVKYCVVK